METYYRKLTNHGGSFTVYLPRKVIRTAAWRLGDCVTVNLDPDGTVRLRKITTPDMRPGDGGMNT
jgi:hypothetical protein